MVSVGHAWPLVEQQIVCPSSAVVDCDVSLEEYPVNDDAYHGEEIWLENEDDGAEAIQSVAVHVPFPVHGREPGQCRCLDWSLHPPSTFS